jgi:hypothetical protein
LPATRRLDPIERDQLLHARAYEAAEALRTGAVCPSAEAGLSESVTDDRLYFEYLLQVSLRRLHADLDARIDPQRSG